MVKFGRSVRGIKT